MKNKTITKIIFSIMLLTSFKNFFGSGDRLTFTKTALISGAFVVTGGVVKYLSKYKLTYENKNWNWELLKHLIEALGLASIAIGLFFIIDPFNSKKKPYKNFFGEKDKLTFTKTALISGALVATGGVVSFLAENKLTDENKSWCWELPKLVTKALSITFIGASAGCFIHDIAKQ
jgi:predicted RecA/RadA family phage recombinase